MNIITAKNICKAFSNNKQVNQVIKNVSINIEKGKITSLMGASGVGKSTLLYILGTLEKPDTGEIIFALDNEIIEYHKCNDKQISRIRNKHIGFVFQFHHLLPEFTALENIMLPALILGTSTKDAELKALSLMDKFSIANIKNQKPMELSGGEQQRTAIARALINSPTIILADEPTGNLDSTNSENVITLIKQINTELNTTFLIATHSEEVSHNSHKIIYMKDGELC